MICTVQNGFVRAFLPLLVVFFGSTCLAQSPTPQVALSFKPSQTGVDYDMPAEADFDKCKVEVERVGKGSGWVVTGPQGQVLRRFVDTDGNNTVDLWRYYSNGLEVYREIDTNADNKNDQFRWLNTGGSKWGLDANQDGKIERWKTISAEEASQEAVRAMAGGDAEALAALLVNSQDLETLGLSSKLSSAVMDRVKDPQGQMKQIMGESRVLNRGTKWVRFDSSMLMPNTIPADSGKAKQDLRVYENVMAIVETGGETAFVQIGEMVRVGDAWKLTQIPTPIEGNSLQVSGGLLMQPDLYEATGTQMAQDLDPALQSLLTELEELDSNSPTPNSSRAALNEYNRKRVAILQRLAGAASSGESREQWMRQMIDGIAAAVQTGAYTEGIQQLRKYETEFAKSSSNAPILAYTVYRRMLAEYSQQLQNPALSDEQRQKVQEEWLKSLQAYAQRYPSSPDAADAMLQLAVAKEFTGDLQEAKGWYQKIAGGFSEDLLATQRAKGALKRMDLVGGQLQLAGASLSGGSIDVRSLQGRAVLVIFWATWCKPCTEDLPQIRALYEKYRSQGFEIVGVNLDTDPSQIRPYMSQYRMTWPQIHEEGGLESRPALSYGVVSLPTMMLTDKSGKVVAVTTSTDELKEQLPELLK